MEKYNKIRFLGCGSYGKVNLVEEVITKEKYALKKIPILFEFSEERETIKKHYETFGRIEHPNIVKIHEIFETAKNICVVMEYLEGGNLSERIHLFKKFIPESQVIHYFHQILTGIQFLHENKIIHRDLKPENILLDKNDHIKICDFDNVRVLETIHQKCQSCVGTPLYVSPEIINFMSYDLKTDIWSLGCILYELCSLKRPFDGNNIVVLRKLITNGKYEPIPSFYNKNLRELVTRMLQINPQRRPTIKQILLEPFIQEFIYIDNFIPCNANDQFEEKSINSFQNNYRKIKNLIHFVIFQKNVILLNLNPRPFNIS